MKPITSAFRETTIWSLRHSHAKQHWSVSLTEWGSGL